MPGSHGSGCQCQHELAEAVHGTQWLNPFVDTDNITSRNEEVPMSCVSLLRPYVDRLTDPNPPCSLAVGDNEYDDAAEEGMVISVPFSCPVKLTGITIIGGANGRFPSAVNLFSNLSDMSAVTELEPSQKIDPLGEDLCGVVEYPLRPVKFAQVNSITLQFPRPDDGRPVEIFWIGLRGIASGDKRKAVVTVYESRANVADHEVKDQFRVGRQIQ